MVMKGMEKRFGFVWSEKKKRNKQVTAKKASIVRHTMNEFRVGNKEEEERFSSILGGGRRYGLPSLGYCLSLSIFFFFLFFRKRECGNGEFIAVVVVGCVRVCIVLYLLCFALSLSLSQCVCVCVTIFYTHHANVAS